MVNIDKMKQERAKKIARMREITDAAQAREDKRMTEAEGQEWQTLNGEVDTMKADIEKEERMQGLEREVAQNPNGGNGEQRQPEPPKEKKPESVEQRSTRLGQFLQIVAGLCHPGYRNLVTPEIRAASGLNESAPSEGAYLVQQEMSAELFKTTIAQSALASKCRRIPIGANANGLKMNAIDETSRATGSRWGGVQAYWLAEADAKTATKPKFRQMELKLKKLAALCYATDELIADAAALGAIISQVFPDEMAWLIDNAIIRGIGAGQPLGILNSPALVTVNAEAGQPADTIVFENIVNMYSRMIASSRANAAWYINQDIEPQLFTMALVVGVGGVPVYLPANGVAGAPYGTLMGRPVIPIEQADNLGDVGDIMFLDLSQYLMIDKGGVEQAESIHVRFTYDETVYRFVTRVDGQPMWSSALTPANGTNTLSPFVTLAARA